MTTAPVVILDTGVVRELAAFEAREGSGFLSVRLEKYLRTREDARRIGAFLRAYRRVVVSAASAIELRTWVQVKRGPGPGRLWPIIRRLYGNAGIEEECVFLRDVADADLAAYNVTDAGLVYLATRRYPSAHLLTTDGKLANRLGERGRHISGVLAPKRRGS